MWEDGEQAAPAAPEAPAAEPKPAAGKGKGDGNISLTKAEYDALVRERDELRTSERYWADRVRGGKQEPAEPAEPEEEDIFADIPEIEGDTDPEKFTDALTAKGAKALEEHGFISKKQMQTLLAKQEARFMQRMEGLIGSKINGAQQQMLKDAELLSTYPELNDQKSEFFKLTQERYRELVADEPSLKKGAGIKIAARMVRAELGKQQTRRADIDRRIAAQQGDMTGYDGGGDDDEDLSPMQRQLIDKFNADGSDLIDVEAYKKRARAGTNMATPRGGYVAGSMRW